MKNLNCLIDLHLHVDGAVSLESTRMLAEKQGIPVPESDEELLKLIRVSDDCRDLNEFLEKFEFPLLLMQSRDGIKDAVQNLLEELKTQGVMYAELRFAPQLHTSKGLSQDDVVQAAIEGLASVSGIDAQLILCCMRGTDNREANIENIDVAEKYLGKGVCAVDLAGAEAIFPTKDFKYIFDYAKQHNVPYTIHAGEADGPESIRSAISYGTKRIGHGVRAYEDPELVKLIADEKITLEVCPTSNIRTAMFSKIADMPIKKLMDAGVILTINTDDPSIEASDLPTEYRLVQEAFSFSDSEIEQLLINSANASFTSEAVKQAMIARIRKCFEEK